MLTFLHQARKLLHLICYPAGVPSSIGGLIANSNDMETVHEAASRILQVSGLNVKFCWQYEVYPVNLKLFHGNSNSVNLLLFRTQNHLLWIFPLVIYYWLFPTIFRFSSV